MTRLGVNIDHVATVRQARREIFPSPLEAAQAAVRGGADGVTAHLREDRRHIQDNDIRALKKTLRVPLNLEMAATPELVAFAIRVRPAWVCLVPEKRHELTTEGGLNLTIGKNRLAASIQRLRRSGVRVSLFVEPTVEAVQISFDLGADAVELHTGKYARVWDHSQARKKELLRIATAARAAASKRLRVNAGHGLSYENVSTLLKAYSFDELNIGFVIVARALFVGMESAVREMKQCVEF